MYQIEFFEYPDGRKPIYEFLESIPRKLKAKVFWEIDLLSEMGSSLTEPYAKHISNELWELRIKFSTDLSRIFYFIATDSKIVLLHAFIKKTDKTPIADINLAQKRLKDYKERCLK